MRSASNAQPTAGTLTLSPGGDCGYCRKGEGSSRTPDSRALLASIQSSISFLSQSTFLLVIGPTQLRSRTRSPRHHPRREPALSRTLYLLHDSSNQQKVEATMLRQNRYVRPITKRLWIEDGGDLALSSTFQIQVGAAVLTTP